MPVGREDAWLLVVNRSAALKEQFPSLKAVMGERPGSLTDREQRAFWFADNRRSMRAAYERQVASDAVARANVDAVVELRRERAQKEFLARFASRQAERKAG